jgi:hypothetical protein
MQTLVDIPEEDIRLLDQLSSARNVSRAELVSVALSTYLESQRPRLLSEEQRKQALDDAFGAWRDFSEDGQAYQDRIRSEWDR